MFIDVTITMVFLEKRIPLKVKDTFIKFLSRPDNMKIFSDRPTTVILTVIDDEGVEGSDRECKRYRFPHMSCMILRKEYIK